MSFFNEGKLYRRTHNKMILAKCDPECLQAKLENRAPRHISGNLLSSLNDWHFLPNGSLLMFLDAYIVANSLGTTGVLASFLYEESVYCGWFEQVVWEKHLERVDGN